VYVGACAAELTCVQGEAKARRRTAERGTYVSEDAWKVIELRENALVVRNGETDPGDPLTPLTFDVWLKGFRREHDFLFAKEP